MILSENADVVELKKDSDSVKIHLHGATIVSWKAQEKELLFLSSKALLDGSKPIRGGIPLVFPQFGTGPIMSGQHGFARTLKWKVVPESRKESSCTFELSHSEATLKLWPHKFTLNYTVSLDSGNLRVRFEVSNCDSDPFEFTALLHTYFNIECISDVKISGLNDLEYSDKILNNEKFTETRESITGINEEVDRNYFNVPDHVTLTCPTGEFVLKSDFKDLVLWNPWIEKSKGMSDFDDNEYKRMICLEFGHVEKPVRIQPNEKWTRKQEICFKTPVFSVNRMYNGIGLRTTRGTGTNGYVQKNLSFIKPKQQNKSSETYKYDEHVTAKPTKKPSEEVLMHNNRRKLENDLLEYEEELEALKKYTKEEINDMIKKRREKLTKTMEKQVLSGKEEFLLEAKEKEMIKMKEAFGIKGNGETEGRAFNFENEKQRQERQERIAQEEKARRYRPY